jgi:uncharacterized protein
LRSGRVDATCRGMGQVRSPIEAVLEAGHESLVALCRECHVRRLDLFGSAVTGRFDHEQSDVDILVAFDELAPGAYEGLERLFDRDVDLLTDVALDNPYLRREIEAQTRTLFSAP